MTKPGLKMSSIHNFKGSEATSVILIIPYLTDNEGNQCEVRHLVHKDEDINATIYTAITRAREKLFIFNLGNNEYHDLFESIKL